MSPAARDLPGDPGLLPSALRGPRGPYVGTPPPARAPRAWAHDERLNALLLELHAGFGLQRWWPARTPFEVCVGAVLTQNTAWANVEQALSRLRRARWLTPARLLGADEERLREAVRPSGYFNVKARKLAELSRWYLAAGGLRALRERPLERVRGDLLGVWGIGPETADSILCYAAGRRTVVIDTYTRRILERHALVEPGLDYEALRRFVSERLLRSQWVHEEFHALCVRAGYHNCKPRALCSTCPGTAPEGPHSGPAGAAGASGYKPLAARALPWKPHGSTV